jgi:hypothetical protein
MPPNADGSPTEAELTVARVRSPDGQTVEAQHIKEVNAIISLGRETYGADQFDSDSAVVAEKLGARTQEFMALARQFDNPHKLVKHFADRPGELEALAKLPTTRILTEISRIEGRSAPYGHAVTRADPLWKDASKGGRLSNEDWNRGVADSLTEEQFDREYRRRQAERRERRGGWR